MQAGRRAGPETRPRPLDRAVLPDQVHVHSKQLTKTEVAQRVSIIRADEVVAATSLRRYRCFRLGAGGDVLGWLGGPVVAHPALFFL